MKSGLIAVAAALTAVIVLPAQAQAPASEQRLSDRQVELYAEMLAMSIACREMGSMRIREEQLHDWMTAELAGGPESDVDEVLALRDEKLSAMQARVAEVNAIPASNRRRDEAVNDHYASALSRCIRMSNHSLAGEFFSRN